MRKQYGQSQISLCPFCSKQASTKSGQGIPTCFEHKESELLNLKCICGDWLDLCQGKWGPYFNCMKCGSVNFRKGMEANLGREIFFHKDTSTTQKEKKPSKTEKKRVQKKYFPRKKSKKRVQKYERKEIIIRSDELDFM